MVPGVYRLTVFRQQGGRGNSRHLFQQHRGQVTGVVRERYCRGLRSAVFTDAARRARRVHSDDNRGDSGKTLKHKEDMHAQRRREAASTAFFASFATKQHL